MYIYIRMYECVFHRVWDESISHTDTYIYIYVPLVSTLTRIVVVVVFGFFVDFRRFP